LRLSAWTDYGPGAAPRGFLKKNTAPAPMTTRSTMRPPTRSGLLPPLDAAPLTSAAGVSTGARDGSVAVGPPAVDRGGTDGKGVDTAAGGDVAPRAVAGALVGAFGVGFEAARDGLGVGVAPGFAVPAAVGFGDWVGFGVGAGVGVATTVLLKVAVSVEGLPLTIPIEHALFPPEQAPVQPTKSDPLAGVSVSFTLDPAANATSHAEWPAPQLIPTGVLMTEPAPVPASVTESATGSTSENPNADSVMLPDRVKCLIDVDVSHPTTLQVVDDPLDAATR